MSFTDGKPFGVAAVNRVNGCPKSAWLRQLKSELRTLLQFSYRLSQATELAMQQKFSL
jgi:hypothetical protein